MGNIIMHDNSFASIIGELIGYYLLLRLLWHFIKRLFAKSEQKVQRETEPLTDNTPVKKSRSCHAPSMVQDTEVDKWLVRVAKQVEDRYFPETFLARADLTYLNRAIHQGKIEVVEDDTVGTLYRIKHI